MSAQNGTLVIEVCDALQFLIDQLRFPVIMSGQPRDQHATLPYMRSISNTVHDYVHDVITLGTAASITEAHVTSAASIIDHADVDTGIPYISNANEMQKLSNAQQHVNRISSTRSTLQMIVSALTLIE